MNESKYKIVFDYVPPDQQEIRELMDFAAVKAGIQTKTKFWTSKKLWVLAATGVTLVALWFTQDLSGPVGWEVSQKDHLKEVEDAKNKDLEAVIVDSVTSEAETVEEAIITSEEAEVKSTVSKIATPIESEGSAPQGKKKEVQRTVAPQPPPAEKRVLEVQQEKDSIDKGEANASINQNISIEPQKSEFVDAHPLVGFDSLYAFFRKELRYPLEPPADTIHGAVELQFAVSKQGKIINPMIVKSMGKVFDEEALRVIANMPEWIPAKVNDMPMTTRQQIAIRFMPHRKSQ